MLVDYITFKPTLSWITVFIQVWMICLYLEPVRALVFCKPLDKCSCQYDHNGTIIDLEPIGKTSGGPRFGYDKSIDGNPNFEYAANICYGFNDNVCKNQVFCQRTITGGPTKYFPIGAADNPVFYANGDGIVYMETYENILRTSVLALECDLTGKKDSPIFIRNGESSSNEYDFTLRSLCACADGCRRSSGGLSFGSILCILFAVLAVVYLIGGMIFMKCVRGANGVEVIPNVEMWKNLPTNIKNGCLYLVHGCKSNDYDSLK